MNEIGLNWLRLKPSKRLYYQPNMDCIVTIETENDKKLSVVFVSIDIEFEPWCGDDYLLMYDGNSTLSPLVDGNEQKKNNYTLPTIVSFIFAQINTFLKSERQCRYLLY